MNSHEKDNANQADLLGKALGDVQALIREAERRGLPEPTSASLATADKVARPSVRTITLSAVLDDGLVFFANMDSGKGKQISQNPRVALCLFWAPMQQQVTIEGDAEILPDDESESLWQKRSRESRIAAWIYDHGGEHEDADTASEKRDQLKAEFGYEPVPRPQAWKAIKVNPDRIEFWETGWHRLRNRMRYQKGADGVWQTLSEGT